MCRLREQKLEPLRKVDEGVALPSSSCEVGAEEWNRAVVVIARIVKPPGD
jgi:hypothetical protein